MSRSFVILAHSNYPLLNVFWTILWLFLGIVWLFLIVRIVTDVFRSGDLGGWAKAAWTVLIIVLPLLGVLSYLIVRGEGLYRRDAQMARATDDAVRDYVRHAADTASVADELAKLAALRDQGVLTQVEFDTQKAKLLT